MRVSGNTDAETYTCRQNDSLLIKSNNYTLLTYTATYEHYQQALLLLLSF